MHRLWRYRHAYAQSTEKKLSHCNSKVEVQIPLSQFSGIPPSMTFCISSLHYALTFPSISHMDIVVPPSYFRYMCLVTSCPV